MIKIKKKNQSAIECDLLYQKIIKEKKEGEKNKKLQMEKNNKMIQKSLMISKRINKISKSIRRKEYKEKIVTELNLSKNEEKKELLFRKRNSINNNNNKYL